MRNSSFIPGTIIQGAREANPNDQVSGASSPTGQDADARAQAAQGPIPEPVSAAENPASASPPATPADLSAEALGRRTLSTAFVMVGPDGLLTVELRNGRVLLLRDVVMRSKDYCGVQVSGSRGMQYCGGYADVAAARPGGLATPVDPGLAASNPVKSERVLSHRK